jgi:hypothetical protein
MKIRLTSLALMLLSITIIFTSCSDKDESISKKELQVTLNNESSIGSSKSIAVWKNQTIKVKATFASHAIPTRLLLNRSVGSQLGFNCAGPVKIDQKWEYVEDQGTCYYKIPAGVGNDFTVTFTITTGSTIPSDNIEVFQFVVALDDNSPQGGDNFLTLVYVDPATEGSGEIQTNNVELGNQKNKTIGQCYSSSTNKVYGIETGNNGDNKIDFIHAYDYSQGAGLVSPYHYPFEGYGFATWNNDRYSFFLLTNLTASDFDNIKYGTDIRLAIPVNDLYVNAYGLTTNAGQNVIGFKTPENKWGLIKITEITGSNLMSGSIKMVVKVQK